MNLTKIAASLSEVNQESKKIMDVITMRSAALLNKIKANNSEIEVNLLCVGGGPACVTSAVNLPKNMRNQSLVIEQNNLIGGIFSEMDFYLNTNAIENQIPGAENRLSSFTKNNPVHSSMLALHAQMVFLESEVPALMGEKINDIKILKNSDGSQSVLLNTASGIKIKAKKVFWGTGFGSGDTKVPDLKYKAEFDYYKNEFKKDKNQLEKVMHASDFLLTLKALSDKNQIGLVTSKLPKVICVFGGGDGARLVLDSIARLKPQSELKIIWIGNGSKNSQEFRKGQNAIENTIREISWLYDHDLLSGFDGLVDGFQEKDGKFLVQIKNGQKSQWIKIPIDMVIDSSGYNPNLPQITGMNETLSKENVFGLADGLQNTFLGIQIKAQSELLPIYQIGVSAGGLLQINEIPSHENKNPATLQNNLGRVQSLTKKIFNN